MVVKLMVSAAQRAMMIQFWQVGYAQTTVDDLMTASQLSRTQFYRQYHNKRVALRQGLQYYQSTLNEQLQLLVERDQARQMPLPALIADWLLLTILGLPYILLGLEETTSWTRRISSNSSPCRMPGLALFYLCGGLLGTRSLDS